MFTIGQEFSQEVAATNAMAIDTVFDSLKRGTSSPLRVSFRGQDYYCKAAVKSIETRVKTVSEYVPIGGDKARRTTEKSYFVTFEVVEVQQ